jgi:hypothetical protein
MRRRAFTTIDNPLPLALGVRRIEADARRAA